MPISLVFATILMSQSQDAIPAWTPKEAPIMTRFANDVSATNPLPEYPRPTMVRKDWMSLNGIWGLYIYEKQPRKLNVPDKHVAIRVPFPIESALSGVMERMGPEKEAMYHRTFKVPAKWKGKRVLLHFGAVDWEATVFVNGKELGTHRGGYDGFSFDITDALKEGENDLRVKVWDPSEMSWQPHGKQYLKNEGIWYTPTTGIWQTVWLEPVPEASIRSLKIENNADGAPVLTVEASKPGAQIRVKFYEGDRLLSDSSAPAASTWVLTASKPRLWSPENPFLYRVIVELVELPQGRVLDRVDSYAAFRTISLGKDDKGRTRICLNGKPYFLVGPLDQGFWPDGLYTAPTDKALKYDLEVTKKLGFNFIRKHVKVEPERWYYWCDKMGFLVFQDMPSGDKYIGGNDPDITRSKESADQFMAELTAMIECRRKHPCIVGWVPFNEGWGQWMTKEVTDFVRKLDPTRLIDNPSGWTDRGVGDMHDIHSYPGPASPKPEANRAAFLGEFGGLGLPMPEHMWQKEGWGYRSYKTRTELTDGIVALFQNLRFLIDEPGLSGAVYTQTTDVEQEVNGLMTYDRAIIKPDAARLTKAVKALFLPPPVVNPVVATSEEKGVDWSYRTTAPMPGLGWTSPRPGELGWKTGPGGFGTRGTPGAIVRTEWNTPEIWLRREIEIPAGRLASPHLRIHHDEDVEVYLDGKPLLKRTGYTTGYVLVPIPAAEAKRLTPGRHLLAVHCKQTGGGQYVDVGIVDVKG